MADQIFRATKGFKGEQLTLTPAANTNAISLLPPVGLAASYSLTLPLDAGVDGQVLQTDGVGNLTWATSSIADVDDSAFMYSVYMGL